MSKIRPSRGFRHVSDKRRRLTAALFILCVLSFSSRFLVKAETVCPDGWVYNGGNSQCYQLVRTPQLNWLDAETACQAEGAHLSSIHSQQEQDFLLEFGLVGWIGLNDIDQEGTFVWSDGTGTDIDLWNTGEPNNLGNEDCTEQFYVGSSTLWNDARCGTPKNYICEKTATDNEDPSILCPSNQTIETALGEDFARISLPSPQSASDNSGIYTITISVDGSTYNASDNVSLSLQMSPHLVQYTVTDRFQNSAGCIMYITVLETVCPDGWVYNGGNSHCYKLVRTPQLNWFDAEAACQAEGAHLASIHSEQERNFLFEFGNVWWIGLNDIDQEGTFVWSDGTELDLVLWNPGEPNNSGGIEDCTEQLYTWNDIACSRAMSYICEKTATDDEDPSVVCPANQTIETALGENFARISLPSPQSVSGNSGIYTIIINVDGSTYNVSDNVSLSLQMSPHLVQYTVTDRLRNSARCIMYITVLGRCASDTTSDGLLTWPETMAGSTANSSERCPPTTVNAGLPKAVRNCTIVGPPVYLRWDDHEDRSCGDFKIDVTLEDVEQLEVSPSNVLEIAGFVANRSFAASKTNKEVEVVSNILVNIVSAGSGDTQVTEFVLQTVNNVIMNAEEISDPGEGGSFSTIVQSAETQVSLTLQQEGQVSIRQDSIHVEGVSLEPMQASNGLSFVQQSLDLRPVQGSPQEGTLADTEILFLNTSEIPKDFDVVTAVRLPGDVTGKLPLFSDNVTGELQASFIVYADDTLFQSALLKDNGFVVAGPVVSLTVEDADLFNLTEPIVIEFKPPANKAQAELEHVQCVFWDFDLEDGIGDWSTAGCTLTGVTKDIVSCGCNHTTNFAILVDVKGQLTTDDAVVRQALDIISRVGCALSIASLVITLIIYTSIRKLRIGKSRQIFIQFCFSLLTLYVVFVAGIDNAKDTACVFVAALLHYLTLSTMMWMAVEARNMYVSTVKVFPEDTPRYMLKASLIAWGTPAIVLTITLAVALDQYKNQHYCFLLPGLLLYVGLLAPIGLILIHNILTFILVMRSLVKVREASLSQQISKRLQNAIGISVLMGLTWCLGFLAIDRATFIFQLIFCLANSLQGVIVFVMFCVRREEVRTALAPCVRRVFCGITCTLPSSAPRKSDEAEMTSQVVTTNPSSVQTANIDISVSEAK